MVTVPRYAPRIHPTPIPTARWDEAPCYCLAVNGEWLSHILGVMIALDQPDTWIGTKEQVYDARQQVLEIMTCFMEGNMGCCCGNQAPSEPVQHRATTDYQLQVSYDGGMTWVQDPDDPRMTSAQMPAPVPAGVSATKCDAATNCLEHLQDGHAAMLARIETGGNIVDIAIDIIVALAALALWVFSAGTLPFFIPFLAGLIQAIISLGHDVWESQFTSDVWDAVLCILYCHIGEDGHFDQAGYDAVMADCESKIPGGFAITSAARSIQAQIGSGGLNGLNNIASYGAAADADCSDCDCGTCDLEQWALVDEEHGVSLTTGNDPVKGDFIQIVGTEIPGFGFYAIAQTPSVNTCCYVGDREMIVGGGDASFFHVRCGDVQDEAHKQNLDLDSERCSNLVQAQSPVAFTVRFYMTSCP